ncbi:peptidoglycan editing factor PgeF [Massilia sp. CCM 8695]|uniref:Purine nucleoside phosphorylase n=1 Tax=Massilia frigida TaxID=2609281 RepID=A0ABX0N7L4_9BURK|nr:peptidoglycan editing factor PgeF [Massilia frigida]NHZ80368.1 peptidoglycan editing factor PgeF [Massilia frigida]
MPGEHLITPDWPDMPAGVGAIATSRLGGVSPAPYGDGAGGGGLNLGEHVGDDPVQVGLNRARLRQSLPGEPAWLSQVHGVAVVDAATVRPGQPVRVGDASIASVPGAVCVVMTADCLPVLFASRDGKVVGAAHAGWRGLAAGVLAETVAAMRAAGAGGITAWLGPAIGPAQFEVGSDVFDSFMAGTQGLDEASQTGQCFVPFPGRPGKYLADIYGLARIMLARDRVTDVSGGSYCTASEPGRFYSYRRDQVTGRHASLIWIK